MPRIAEPREGVAPESEEQRRRYARILAAASDLAADVPLERVQMAEVARTARVAVATVYRYFPSKTHLFVAVLLDQISRFGATVPADLPAGQPPSERMYAVLLAAQRALAARPSLSGAMIQSANTANATVVTDVHRVEERFREVLLRAIGVEEPGPDDVERVRLVMELWYGVLSSLFNSRITAEVAEADLRRGCGLLLAELDRA